MTPSGSAPPAVPAAAITTGSACHLDAEMVHAALDRVAWRELDYLFVENVGNLVCPAVYDLGQAVNVVALSVTEGEDKPLKYPVMFRKADLVLLTKLDLLPYVDVRVEAVRDALARVTPDLALIEISARSGQGIPEWIAWLEGRRSSLERAAGAHHHPHPHGHPHPDPVADLSSRSRRVTLARNQENSHGDRSPRRQPFWRRRPKT